MIKTNLFGINIENHNDKIIRKINNPKKAKTKTNIKSKKLSTEERLNIINDNVDKTLGVYKDKTQVIKSKLELFEYVDRAWENDIIAIDTETNNSLDPLTCKLMGLCLYTPRCMNAYIPVNHTDINGNRLDWQVTEQDIKEALELANRELN